MTPEKYSHNRSGGAPHWVTATLTPALSLLSFSDNHPGQFFPSLTCTSTCSYFGTPFLLSSLRPEVLLWDQGRSMEDTASLFIKFNSRLMPPGVTWVSWGVWHGCGSTVLSPHLAVASPEVESSGVPPPFELLSKPFSHSSRQETKQLSPTSVWKHQWCWFIRSNKVLCLNNLLWLHSSFMSFVPLCKLYCCSLVFWQHSVTSPSSVPTL